MDITGMATRFLTHSQNQCMKAEVNMRNNPKGILALLFLFSLFYACPANVTTFPMMGASQMESAVELGITSVPYFVYSNADLKRINEVCVITKKKVTIADTYQSAYGKNYEEYLPEGDTGQAFRTMQEASGYLQKILKDNGEQNPDQFYLTSIETERKKGYILYAVVQRPQRSIKVSDKFIKGTAIEINPVDIGYYQAYESDATGKSLDTVIDWAGIPVDCTTKQGSQAILLTLSANKVLDREIKRGYWEAEKLWLKGDYDTVMKVQDQKACEVCGLTEGFYK